MTLHASDLLVILAMLAAGFVAVYLLVLRRMRRLIHDAQMTIADRQGALDEAIQALETRLAEHHPAPTREVREIAGRAGDDHESAAVAGEPVSVDPEVKAVIAAAATAALGQSAIGKAIKPVSSPWSQQGRVLVQGSHNLRTRR